MIPVLVFSVTAFGICVFPRSQINILFIYLFSSISVGMQTMDGIMIRQCRLKSPGRGQKGLFGFQQSEMLKTKEFLRRFQKSSVLLFYVKVLIKWYRTFFILLYGAYLNYSGGAACHLIPFSHCLLSRLRGLLCFISQAWQRFSAMSKTLLHSLTVPGYQELLGLPLVSPLLLLFPAPF